MENESPAPRKPRRSPTIPESWSTTRIILLSLALLGIYVIGQTLAFGFLGHMFAAVACGGLLALAAATAVSLGRGLSPARDFGFASPGLMQAAAATVVALAATAPSSLLAGWSTRIHPPGPEWIELFNRHLPHGARDVAIACFAAIVVVPLIEELIFRGLLYRACRRHWGVFAAAAVSALVFALVHGEPWYLFGLVGIGTVLALVYEFSGSLVLAVWTHAVYNAFSLAMILREGGIGTEPQTEDPSLLLVLPSLALLAVALLALRRRS